MKAAAVLAIGLSLGGAASAEPWFRDVTATHLPARETSGRWSMDVQAADLDGDGDLDLVVPQEFRLNKLLFNDGQGRFADGSGRLPALTADELKGGPPLPGHDSEDVSIADFDGDGKLDLAIVSEDDVRFGRSPAHELYRGDGRGGFARVLGQVPDTEANAVAHADVTGDGRPDLLVAGAGQERLLVNAGGMTFRDETDVRLPRDAAVTQDAVFVDVDGDGDADLVLGHEGGHSLWINDGRGRFTDESAARLPRPGFVEARKITPVDVDRDGDLDLYLSHTGWQGKQPQDRLYLNDGRGRFADGTEGRVPTETETSLDAEFGDLDGDGDLDLVRADLGAIRVFENDGSGRFRELTGTALPAPVEGFNISVALADVNADGALDLYVGQLANPQNQPESWDRLLLGVRRR